MGTNINVNSTRLAGTIELFQHFWSNELTVFEICII